MVETTGRMAMPFSKALGRPFSFGAKRPLTQQKHILGEIDKLFVRLALMPSILLRRSQDTIGQLGYELSVGEVLTPTAPRPFCGIRTLGQAQLAVDSRRLHRTTSQKS